MARSLRRGCGCSAQGPDRFPGSVHGSRALSLGDPRTHSTLNDSRFHAYAHVASIFRFLSGWVLAINSGLGYTRYRIVASQAPSRPFGGEIAVRIAVACSTVLIATSLCHGAINLALRPQSLQYNVGDQVAIQILASATTGEPEGLLSFQMIFSWDTSRLHLTGLSGVGGASFTASGFFHDAYGINELAVPTDGNAMFVGLGPLGSSIVALPNGSLMSTLLFTAVAPSPGTPISILSSAGSPVGTTVVYGDAGPNVNVTGSLTGTSVRIVPAPAGALLLAVGVLSQRRRRDAPADRTNA